MKVSKFLPCAIIFPILALLALPTLCRAQTLRGAVRNADNGLPVAGALVIVQGQRPDAVAAEIRTDSAGRYAFGPLRPGYYLFRIEAAGFDDQTIAEVNVAAGKEQLLDVGLRRAASPLPEVTIAADQPGRREVQPLSEIPLTRDQTLRFPATFFDPARLAMAYPGVAQTDDGINGMSIRGNSPASVRWRLAGVDIVNPNHLPNGGTFYDLPTGASGGVLMFSAQLLDNSSLLTGNYPTSMGDAQGGVMDMHLRPGNNRQREFTVQAGLIGLDVAAEGPLTKKENAASYLVNYRYATVGLLSQLGVSFGDEAINFQDLSFHLRVPGKRGGHWSVFGMGGLSENQFTHKDSAEVETDKQRYDIGFSSKTGVFGTSGLIQLGARTWLKPTLVLSTQHNDRFAQETLFKTGASVLIREDNRSTELRTVGALTLQHVLSDRLRFQGGVNISNVNYQYDAEVTIGNFPGTFLESPIATQWGWGWVQLGWKSRSEKTGLQIGTNYTYRGLDKSSSLEPRLTLSQRLSQHQQLHLAYGLHSQMQPLWVYAIDANGAGPGSPNRLLGPTKAQHIGLQHAWNNGSGWVVKTELYYQYLTDVPVTAAASTNFSLLNYHEPSARNELLANRGAGRNKGVELNVERFLRQGWFLLANVSLFDSEYRGSDSVWRSTRWDLGHLANFTLGKEWVRDRGSEKVRAFGLNGRLVWTGGYRNMPVDAFRSASTLLQKTAFDESNGFSGQFPDYFRIDLRAYWKRSLGDRRNSTFAMDLQNVTLQQNVAYQFYDPFTQKVETKYQLGLIPNISWRLEF